MRKKLLSLILAVCLIIPCIFMLTACKDKEIKQPAQETMHQTYLNAAKTIASYNGSWTITQTGSSTYTENEDTETETETSIKTYNAQTSEYVNYSLNEENEVGYYRLIKKQSDGSYVQLSKSTGYNVIVDQAYAQKEFAKAFLNSLGVDDEEITYEEFIAEIEDEEAEQKEEYSQDGYTYNTIDYSAKYVKTSETQYKLEMVLVIDYNCPEEEGIKTRMKQNVKITNVFDANGIVSVTNSMNYEGISTNSTTNEQTAYMASNYSATITISKTYDTTAMGKVDLTDVTMPTNKLKQQLNIYYDGESEYSEYVDFGTNIDTIISGNITARENCTIDTAIYLDEEGTIPYTAGLLTSSINATNVYLKSKPNDGYAFVEFNYNEISDDNNDYINVQERRYQVVTAGTAVELDPVRYEDTYCDLVKKNGVATTEKSFTAENGQSYIFDFYKNAVEEEQGAVTVYVNGTLSGTYDNGYSEYTPLISFISYIESDITYEDPHLYNETNLYNAAYDYEIYKDAACTQKVDKFDKLGSEDKTVYIKTTLNEEYVVIVITDPINDYVSEVLVVTAEEFIYRMPISWFEEDDNYYIGTINDVDFSESPYITTIGTMYQYNLVGGQVYDIYVVQITQ